jgi:hypothetical protein
MILADARRMARNEPVADSFVCSRRHPDGRPPPPPASLRYVDAADEEALYSAAPAGGASTGANAALGLLAGLTSRCATRSLTLSTQAGKPVVVYAHSAESASACCSTFCTAAS